MHAKDIQDRFTSSAAITSDSMSEIQDLHSTVLTTGNYKYIKSQLNVNSDQLNLLEDRATELQQEFSNYVQTIINLQASVQTKVSNSPVQNAKTELQPQIDTAKQAFNSFAETFESILEDNRLFIVDDNSLKDIKVSSL